MGIHSMSDPFRVEYLNDMLNRFQKLKELGEKAINQVSDDQFSATLDSEENSIAILVKHVSGNLRSRWTRFLESDGEKPDRHRDSEFKIDSATSRDAIMAEWKRGWDILFRTIQSLTPPDLDLKVHIQGDPYRVGEAISRQLIHYAYHVGQIVMLAKHLASDDWICLSTPHGRMF